jgi:VWFA-related protein
MLLLGLVTLLVAATALTQSNITSPTQRAEQDNLDAVGSTLITVNVIVTDRSGHYVEGLMPDQFDIDVDNVKQEFTHFATDDFPASIGIVYEVNENDTELLTGVLNALEQFVSTLESNDDVFFVAFNKRGSVTAGSVPAPAQVLDYLKYVGVGDPFSPYDSIHFASERLKQSPNVKKALLVISDAKDNANSYSSSKLRYRLKTLNAPIYFIGLTESTTDASRSWFFEDLTRQSGQRSFLLDADAGVGRTVLEKIGRSRGKSDVTFAESESELAGICTQIVLELRRQYTIGFYVNATGRRKWHTLKVHLRNTGTQRFILSYPESYFY